MTYTKTQIETAKKGFNSFMKIETFANYEYDVIGKQEAERRAEYHNQIVTDILNGNKELEKEWKMFFLNDAVKQDQKEEASKAKLKANKEASADVLAPIKELKKIGAFGKWLNNSSNPFRKQHFNKKYTVEAVNEFLKTI